MNHFTHQLTNFKETLCIRNYSRQSIQAYTDHTRLFLQWLSDQGIIDLRAVTEELLTQYQRSLMDKSYSLQTIHIKLRSLKRFFAFLEETNALLINPAEKLLFPRLGDRLPRNILTVEEMKRLLALPNTAAPRGLRDRAILELLYSTGLRLSECISLTVHDVDYKGGYVRVNQGKGAKGRVVPLGAKACGYLKHYLLKVRPHYCATNPDEQTLFLSERRRPLSPQRLMMLLRSYGKKAGIEKPVTVHTLRRSCATHLLRNNAHPLYIQRLLGHETSETMNKYIKITGADIKKTHTKTHPREKDKR